MTDQTAEHYERVAATYDEHWTYNPDYVRGFSQAITDVLRLTRSDAIADIGCGTGLYTRRLYEDLRPVRPILCVDPVPAMLDRLPASPGLRPLLVSAEDLATRRVVDPEAVPLDAIIMKDSGWRSGRPSGGWVGCGSRSSTASCGLTTPGCRRGSWPT